MPTDFEDYPAGAPVPLPVFRQYMRMGQKTFWRLKNERPEYGFPVDQIFMLNGVEHVFKHVLTDWIADLARDNVRRRVGRKPRQRSPVEQAERALVEIKRQMKQGE